MWVIDVGERVVEHRGGDGDIQPVDPVAGGSNGVGEKDVLERGGIQIVVSTSAPALPATVPVAPVM